MKRIIFIWAIICPIVFFGCSKNNRDEAKFNFKLETLIGTWRITHVENKNGEMLDVTTEIAEKVFSPTYATFNSDGTYSGKGSFGNGTGTFKASGNTITCYIGNTEYMKLDVLSLDGTQCELKMHKAGSSSIKIRCKKE